MRGVLPEFSLRAWQARIQPGVDVVHVRDKIDPKQKDERGVSMSVYMHSGHYRPQGTFKSVKYGPQDVHAQCPRCNKLLHGNLAAYAIALEKRYGFGILQTLDRRSRLYFEYTIPVLEKLTAARALGPKEYFILYELLRPKEEKEIAKVA
jgi:hypothetical protein